MPETFTDVIRANYAHVYLFTEVGVCKVARDKYGNFSEVFYRCDTTTCECPAGTHGVRCRHIEMRMQTFASKKVVNAVKLSEVLRKYETLTFGTQVTHTVRPGCANVISRKPRGDEPYPMVVAIENHIPLYWIFT